MLHKYKYLILILAVIFLFSAKPAFALFGVGDFGLFDIPDQILGGLEEKTGPVFAAVVGIFLTYISGLAALSLSGHYLEKFILNQQEVISALEPMTRTGWDFIAGMTNMLLVLVFLIIAFAFIFKIETFQAQKALPKLIIVALLINFSFLFVQMLIDISQVVYNTVVPQEDFFSMAMKVFISPGESVIKSVISWMVSLAVAWAIPMGNAFSQVLFSALFTVFILPNVIIWIIQAIFFWLLAGMFFFFTFLFAARIFVLQILTILAPLAFLCLVLPQTKSFWSMWFKTLLEWLLLGIFFLFFFVLGFGVLGRLAPPGSGGLPLPGESGFVLPEFFIYYFVVFVYMAVMLLIGKKFIPQGAQALIDFGKGIAGTVVTRGLKPIGKQAKTTKKELDAEIGQRATRRAERIEQKIKSGGMKSLTRGERITAWNLRRKGKGDLSTGVEITKADSELAQRRLVSEKKRAYSARTKDLDEEGQKAFYKKELLKMSMSPEALTNAHSRVALAELASDADAVDGDNPRVQELMNKAIQSGGKTTRKKIYSRNPQWAPDGKAEEEGTFQNIIATINPADIDKLSKAAKLNERVIQEIVNTRQENLINRLGGQNKMVRDKTQTEIDKATGGDNWKTNVNDLIGKGNIQEAKKVLHLLRNFHTSQAATNIGWKQYGTIEEIEEMENKVEGKTPTSSEKRVTLPGEEEFKETEKKIREDLEK